MIKRKQMGTFFVLIVSAAYCCGYFGCILSPVATEFYAALNSAPPFWVNFAVSGASFISIFVNLSAAFLSRYISKKKLHLSALLMFSIAGVGFASFHSLTVYVFCRILCSIAVGISFVTVPGIICEVFEDARERSRYFGMGNIVSTLIGMLFSFLSGAIAVRTAWNNVFYLMLVSLPIFVMSLIFIPDNGPEAKPVGETRHTGEPLVCNKLFFAVILAGQIAMNLFFGVMYYLSDLYVSGTGIGDSMLTGTEMSLGMLSGALISAAFAYVYRHLGRWTSPLSWLLVSLPFLMLGLIAGSVSFVVFGALALGMISLNYLYYQQKFSELAPGDRVTLFMSLNSAACVTGTSLSAYVPGIINRISGISDIREMYLVLGISMLICTFISLLCTVLVHDSTDRLIFDC